MVNGARDKELQSFLNADARPVTIIKAILPKMRLDSLCILNAGNEICAGRLSAQGASDASQFGYHHNRARSRGCRERRRGEAGFVHRQVDATDISRPKWSVALRLAGFDRTGQIFNPERRLRAG